MGAGGIDPVGHLGQGRFAVVSGLIGIHFGQAQRQLVFRHRDPTAFFAINQRNGFAPIPLTGEDPVAEFIVDLGFALLLFFQPFHDLDLGFFHAQAVQEAGIDHNAGIAVGEGFFLHIAALDHFNDRQAQTFWQTPSHGCRGPVQP